MRGPRWSALGVLLVIQFGSARAEEILWRSARPQPGGQLEARLWAPLPLPDESSTCRPGSSAPPAANQDNPALPRPLVRCQNNELPPLPLPPLPRDEQYNRGVITHTARANGGFLEGCKDFINGIGSNGKNGRSLFQSDHCFDETAGFISPVTNPFIFEDPRALTEVRPIFLLQTIPNSNWITKGGTAEFFGIQARLAINECWSIVFNKLGLTAFQPDQGLNNAAGFSELWLGPKWTFLRIESTGTVGAAGLTFQIPAGTGKVYQDTGDLSLVPYFSVAQHFGQTGWGAFNFMGTVGYSFSTDNVRSEYFVTSLHLDFDVNNAHKIYPLVELNWFHYTRAGNTVPLGFEGRDLFNFGAGGVSGHDDLMLAVGARYKFCEAVQAGLGVEFPLNGARNLFEFRLTLDMIFRY